MLPWMTGTHEQSQSYKTFISCTSKSLKNAAHRCQPTILPCLAPWRQKSRFGLAGALLVAPVGIDFQCLPETTRQDGVEDDAHQGREGES